MDDDCYGCPYYGSGDIEGCNLTIKFYKEHPDPENADEDYKNFMISNGRVEK
jgi:hypothetical protein